MTEEQQALCNRDVCFLYMIEEWGKELFRPPPPPPSEHRYFHGCTLTLVNVDTGTTALTASDQEQMHQESEGWKKVQTHEDKGRTRRDDPVCCSSPQSLHRLKNGEGSQDVLGSVVGNVCVCVWAETEAGLEWCFVDQGWFWSWNLWSFYDSYSCQVPTKLAVSFLMLWPLFPQLWPLKPAQTLLFAERQQNPWFLL